MPENSSGRRLTADELIELLGLTAHDEGGHYKETYRDQRAIDDAGRAASSAIYFLLKAGEVSSWHRIDASEVWHWYAGDALELRYLKGKPGSHVETLKLGNDLLSGERPQAVIPAGCWQHARSLGEYTLVGCTVAPAFMFERFELAPDKFGK